MSAFPDIKRVRQIFTEALQKPMHERRGFVESACGGDDALRREVEGLLSAMQGAVDAGFFTAPTFDAPAHAVESAISEKPGTRIGPYKLLQLIGEGGFGAVFMAEQDEPVRRRVALKIIKLGMDTKQVIARFEAERQALALMDHPHIAKVLDAGATETGRPYFVMELVKGEPITTYCDKHSLTIAERLQLFAQVCAAVQHAHTKGVIHRDLKPSNILVSTHDGAPFARVIDFGIAKATSARLTEKTLFTEHRQLIGTPEYMSPEQADGSYDIDTRSDVYSLGVILYELLTGTTPFDARNLRGAAYGEIQRIIREVDPPKPSTRLSQSSDTLPNVAARRQTEARKLGLLVRGDLDWIVMKSLEKDRARRYETASSLADDVARHLGHEPVLASPPSATYKLRKLVRRHKAAVTSLAAIFAVLVIGIVGIALALGQAVDARRQMQGEAEKSEEVAEFLQTMLAGIEPHVALGQDTSLLRQLLDDTSQTITSELRDQPEVEAAVRRTMGSAYRAIGERDEAEAQYNRAIELLESRLGPEHVDTLLAHAGRAAVLFNLGRFAESEAEYRRITPLLERELGSDDPQVLRLKLDIAQIEVEDGRMREAEESLLALRNAYDRKANPNDEDRLSCLSVLSYLYRLQDRFDDAEQLAAEVLERRSSVLSPDHPDVLHSLQTLANLYATQDRLKEAEPLMQRAVEGRRRVLGDDHPSTLAVQRNLATLLWKQQRLAESEALLADVIERQDDRLGPEHPDTVNSKQLLAVIYSMDGRHAEAEALYRDLLETGRRVQGPNHPDTLVTMANLARLLATVERYDEAEPLLELAYEEHSAIFGPDHMHSLMMAQLLQSVYEAQGKTEEAKALLDAQYERELALCAKPGATAFDLNNCAWTLLTSDVPRHRDVALALEYAERACRMEEEAGGGELWKYLDTLALAQHETGDSAAALAIQKRVLALMPANDPNRAEVEQHLAKYEAALAALPDPRGDGASP